MCAALLVLMLCGCAAERYDSLQAVLDRHTSARGGADALDAIASMRIRLEIVESGFTVRADYRAIDGRMRIDVRADGRRVFSEGVDADGAWQQDGADAPVTEASAAGRAALLHGIEFNLFGLHRLAARGHTLSLAPEETLDGVRYQVVHVRLADGFETWLYIDPRSRMIERRRDVRALHPDADPAQRLIENRYADFRPLCGVLFPTTSHQVDVITGEVLQSTRIVQQDCNLPPQKLALPRDAGVD